PMQEAQRRVASGGHKRDVVKRGNGIDDSGECIFFNPDFDIGIGAAPKGFAVKSSCVLKRLNNVAKGYRLTLPARSVSEPVVRQPTVHPHLRKIDLDFVVASLFLFDEAAHRRLIEDLPHGHGPLLGDDVQQGLAASLNLDLGGASALYVPTLRVGNGSRRAPLKLVGDLVEIANDTRRNGGSALCGRPWRNRPRPSRAGPARGATRQ